MIFDHRDGPSMNKRIYNLFLSRIFVPTLILMFAFATQAKVYKWTDEKGKIHYSDKPIDEKSQPIKMKRQPTSTEIMQAKKRASTLIQHQNKVQSIADEEARDKQVELQKNEKNLTQTLQTCKEAKRLIRIYSNGRPIFTKDENGKKTYKNYTDDKKNQMIAELQKNIKENCNN